MNFLTVNGMKLQIPDADAALRSARAHLRMAQDWEQGSAERRHCEETARQLIGIAMDWVVNETHGDRIGFDPHKEVNHPPISGDTDGRS
jgi:hypothetical protein